MFEERKQRGETLPVPYCGPRLGIASDAGTKLLKGPVWLHDARSAACQFFSANEAWLVGTWRSGGRAKLWSAPECLAIYQALTRLGNGREIVAVGRLRVNSDGLVAFETFPVRPRKPTWEQTSVDFAFVPEAVMRRTYSITALGARK
jgi:hypothetical protein